MEGLQIVGSALAIIASLVAGARWLMKVNYKLTQQTLDAKKEVYAVRLEGLKEVIRALEIRLNETENKLEKAAKSLDLATCALNETKSTMVTYVESTEKKITAFESRIVKLSNDLIMIKSKPKGVI